MKKFTNLVINNPKYTLGLVLLLTVIIGLGMTKLEIRNNQEAELPQDDPIVMDLKEVEAVFGERTIALIGLETDNVYNPKTLQKIMDISSELESVEFVVADEINSIATINNVKQDSDGGIDIGPYMNEVPTNQKQIDFLRAAVVNNETINGQFVSEDGTVIVVAAAVEKGYDQTKFYSDIQEVVAQYEGPETIHTTGEPIWLQDIELGIKKDSDTIVPIAILIVLFGIFLSFRRLIAVLLPLACIVLSIIWTMGLMGYLGLPMTVVSNALPAIMIVVASSYCIHILFSYFEHSDSGTKREVVEKMMDKVSYPIAITGITTAISTLSLVVFKVTSLKEFGFVAGIGILIATLIILTVMPALLMLIKKQEIMKDTNLWLRRGIIRLTTFATNQRIAVLFTTLCLLLVSVYGISTIKVGENMMKFFPEGNKGRTATDLFNDKLNGVRVMDIMIDSKEPDGVKSPEFYGQLKEFQNYIEAQPGIGNTFSIVDMVDEIEETLNNDKGTKTEMTQEAIAQYLLLYSMSGDPGDLNAMVDDDYQKTKIQVLLKTSEPLEHQKIAADLKQNFKANFDKETEIRFGGDVMLWIAQIDYIVKGKIQNIILSIGLLILVCGLLFRSLSASLFCSIPIVISMLQVFGLMGLMGIRLELATAMLTAISVGIGIDFSIHYLSRIKMEKKNGLDLAIFSTARTTGQAISYDTLSNMIGFSILVLSGFTPVRNFGLMLTVSMGVICLNTIVLLPALLKVLKPKYFVEERVVSRQKLEGALLAN